jgi:hypothetical protein
VAAIDEALGGLAADEDVERITEREGQRERIIDQGVHEHPEGAARGRVRSRDSSCTRSMRWTPFAAYSFNALYPN